MGTRAAKLLGVGLAPAAAQQIVGDVQLGVTAAGTTQTGATLVYGDNVVVTTCASGAGIILSTNNAGFGPGDDVFVSNQGANACLVYPPIGGQINALGTNVGFSVTAGKSTFFRSVGGGQMYAMASS